MQSLVYTPFYLYGFNRKGKVMEQYILDKEYFHELLDKHSKILVGKAMKRFETSTDLPSIKSQIKESIYEEARALKHLLDAHAAGYERVEWVLKTNSKGKV